MQPQTIFLMGPSGVGKGTQSRLFCDYLKKRDSDREVLYVQVGKLFRELAEKKNLTGALLDRYINEGLLVPEFLTVWAWGQLLIADCKEDQHLLFDGTPRRMKEAEMLQRALQFYKRKNMLVIVLKASKEWSRKLLAGRGREDDIDPRDVERRLEWYDTDVVPVLDYFREADEYEMVEINSEQSIEAVHQDVINEFEKRNG